MKESGLLDDPPSNKTISSIPYSVFYMSASDENNGCDSQELFGELLPTGLVA